MTAYLPSTTARGPTARTEPTGYWLFEPTQPRVEGAQSTLPIVLFLHGFDVTDPEIYHAWIDHLVRRGAVLVFPDYQAPNLPFNPEMHRVRRSLRTEGDPSSHAIRAG